MDRYLLSMDAKIDASQIDADIDYIDFQKVWVEALDDCKELKNFGRLIGIIDLLDYFELYKFDIFLDCLYNISFYHTQKDQVNLLVKDVWPIITTSEAFENQIIKCHNRDTARPKDKSEIPYRLFLKKDCPQFSNMYNKFLLDKFEINMIAPFVNNWTASYANGSPDLIIKLAPEKPHSIYDFYLFEKATHFSFCYRAARMEDEQKSWMRALENRNKGSVIYQPPFYGLKMLNLLCSRAKDISQFIQWRDHYSAGVLSTEEYWHLGTVLLNKLISKCGQEMGDTLTLCDSKIEKLQQRLHNYIAKESTSLLDDFPVKANDFFHAYQQAIESCREKSSTVIIKKQQEWHQKFLENILPYNFDYNQNQIPLINTEVDESVRARVSVIEVPC